MNVSNFFLAAFFPAALLFSPPTLADTGAPALSDVTEILIQPARASNVDATDACGSSGSAIAEAILKALKMESLPAYSVIEAPPLDQKIARIEIIPEISTLPQQGADCISWLSLNAQSRATAKIPPIETPRNITVQYWRGGLMLSTLKISHGRAIAEAAAKLAAQFAKQYRLDQPPPLPDFSEPKK